MKRNTIVALLSSILLVCSFSALAQTQKRPDVSDFPFWTAPKSGYAHPFVPGLNAALLLTDAQKEKITAARQEIFGREAVQAAARVTKTDPATTEAQKKAAHDTLEAANAQLHARVLALLTTEQQRLITQVNAAYEETQRAVQAEISGRYATAKGNADEMETLRKEAQEKLVTEFTNKLEFLLNDAQSKAMKQAAEEEKQRAAAAAANKKPK